MKQSIYRNSIISFILTFVAFWSCNEPLSNETLHGTWQVTEMEADMPTLSPAIVAKGEELALSTTYVFRENGTSLITSEYYPEGFESVWILNLDSMQLTVNSADEAIPDYSDYKISFVNNRKIELTEDIEELGSLKMTLVKKR